MLSAPVEEGCSLVFEHDQLAAMSKIYTSGNVKTFEGCFRALPKSPEKLR